MNNNMESQNLCDSPTVTPLPSPLSSPRQILSSLSSPSRRGRYRSTIVDVATSMNRLPSTMIGREPENKKRLFRDALGQIPAIALIGMFHLMIGIPFGVSYFPISWSPGASEEGDGNGGPFPLPGKESFGIRMFLFSTMIGQLVFSTLSDFPNPIGLNMVENVPFCHELAKIVMKQQGYGVDALSTLIVMFGLSSIVVGIVFYALGRFKLGRIVYFFPTHVLIGCIGGIGVFIAKTGIEVTVDDDFSIDVLIDKSHLIGVVILFEIALRVLEQITKDAQGKSKYSLLTPIYFCMITPVFYLALAVLRIPLSVAKDSGYFFPFLDDDAVCQDGDGECTPISTLGSPSVMNSILLDQHLWDMWKVVNIPTVSWVAVWDSIPTLVALTLFSLIHVPINIPAFALSTNTEADMNNELIAHGYANFLSGIFGGLQNYMAYTQSVLYDKSGGKKRPSGFAVAALTGVLFVVGPTIASYLPRSMAGTLLIHVGIDLFLEGVFDSFGKFDNLEYSGIWLIVVVMTLYGMDAAMMAGVIAAISTYVVQSIAYISPIRGSMSAVTLRSSNRNRSSEAEATLNSLLVGRSRILVVQLQGHLFFGNMAHFTEKMHQLLTSKSNGISEEVHHMSPLVVIMDFSLVVSIDSSAAHAISKLKSAIQRKYQVGLCIYVAGSDDGFPTEFNLSEELSATPYAMTKTSESPNETTSLLESLEEVNGADIKSRYSGSHVCESLDSALIFAEDALIAREDFTLLEDDDGGFDASVLIHSNLSASGEREIAIHYLSKLNPKTLEIAELEVLFSLFEREVYQKDQFVWRQDSASDCAKLLVSGSVRALLENEAGTSEMVSKGNLIGELGLVEGDTRMSSVQCISHEAILYSLSRESWEELVRTKPRIARYIDLICIKYLALRVQHVSNRIFETRCLPI